MKICPQCAHPNADDKTICDNCGSSLDKAPLSTVSLKDHIDKILPPPQTQTKTRRKTDKLKPFDNKVLLLEVEGQKISYDLKPGESLLLGRAASLELENHLLNLTPYGGYLMGVSRRHAIIRCNQENALHIQDIGSSNGTWLNSQALTPHWPTPLHDGDELIVGKIVIQVTFQDKGQVAESFTFTPMSRSEAERVFHWRYPYPYDIYNIEFTDLESELAYFADPANHFYSARNNQGDFVGFACYGHDAQIIGGDYNAPALDISLGLDPRLVGQGRGHAYLQAVLDFASSFPETVFRATIAEFNERARHLFEAAGFEQTQRFERAGDKKPFRIYIKVKGEK